MKLAARSILPGLLGMFCLAVAPAYASSGPDAKTDATTVRIEKEVRHELLLLPYYSVFDNLTYQVEGTKVILSGEVWQPVVKPDAEAAVRSIDGVTLVVNNIRVLPPSNMDDELRRKLYFAIYSYPPLAKYSWQAIASIHIIVDSGRVTLEGVVDNQSDKEAAGMRANGVSGVLSVQNNLRVPSR
jgi:hyperosmotically inducible protein